MSRKKRTATAKEVPLHRSCGTMATHMLLLEQHPSFRKQQVNLEQEFNRRRAMAGPVGKTPLANIKVVVNVVYNTAAQNVSLGQIKTQIKVLNQDFSATNPDRSNVPAPWTGLVTDSRVRFKLAKVRRVKTAAAGFTHDDSVKRAATGGIAPYQPKKYLNLWVCPLTGGLLGYAQFPGGPVATDGVVINFRAFGTNGTAQAPFSLGRTATHEVGHYFNLRHIWGDTEDCSGTDFVADTPNAIGPNFDTPTFPHVSCSNGPNGDMFVNYMDYVDDKAMFMFTTQQVLRMRSAITASRGGLL